MYFDTNSFFALAGVNVQNYNELSAPVYGQGYCRFNIAVFSHVLCNLSVLFCT